MGSTQPSPVRPEPVRRAGAGSGYAAAACRWSPGEWLSVWPPREGDQAWRARDARPRWISFGWSVWTILGGQAVEMYAGSDVVTMGVDVMVSASLVLHSVCLTRCRRLAPWNLVR